MAEATIEAYTVRLKRIAKKANLLNPSEVKTAIALSKQSNGTKQVAVNAYTDFLKYKGLKWERPHYKREETIPFIPTEQEIDALISASSKTISTLLQLLKETGARIIEALKTKQTQIDYERKTIRITPAKGSNPRILPISTKLIGMIKNLRPRQDNYIFNPKPRHIRVNFQFQRKNIAKKLNNPRLKQIHFHTFRHWKGTTEYHKTKDIIHVKTILGHKAITSTMIYINIEQALFLQETDEWTTIVTHNIKEETKAINAGFQLVRAVNETTAIYKKRK